MKLHILYQVINDNENKELKRFENFYDAINAAIGYKDIKVFKLAKESKILIGLRLHSEEIVWRLPRSEKKKRGRDSWFYNLMKRITPLI